MESRVAENGDDSKVQSLVDVNNSDSKAKREESVRRCVLVLEHASQCRDINCQTEKCPRLKQILQHVRQCKKRQESQCSICKQLIALCCFHAKKCTDQECKVPFCKNIQAKIAEKNDEALIREFELVKIEDIEQFI